MRNVLRSPNQKAQQYRRHVRLISRKRILDHKRQGLLIERQKRIVEAYRHGLVYDPDMLRKTLVLPRVFSLVDNYEETATTLDKLRTTVLKENKPVMLHFEKMEHIDPSAALTLVAEIYRCRKLRVWRNNGSFVTGTYPRHPAVRKQLSDMGFYGLLDVLDDLGVPEEDSEIRPAFLRFMTGNQVLSRLIAEFVAVVQRHEIVTLNPQAQRRLVGALIEAMSNADEHGYRKAGNVSRMNRRWWISASIDVVNREVCVMLFDQGVGIPVTLDLSLYDKVAMPLFNQEWLQLLRSKPSDGVIVKAATELHRTSTQQSGRGKGFRDMKAFVDQCKTGTLRVLSNRGQYHYVGGSDHESADEGYTDVQQSLGGTLIEWRICSDQMLVMDDE
jgi:hypothetical protein